MKDRKISTKLVSIICLAAVLFSTMSGISAYAKAGGDNTVAPCWDNIKIMTLDLYFEGTTGTVAATASKKVAATSMEGFVDVFYFDGGWVYIDTWYGDTTGMSLGIVGTFDAESGVRYRAEFYLTAYKGSTPEKDSMVRMETCP